MYVVLQFVLSLCNKTVNQLKTMKNSNHISEQAKATLTIWAIAASIVTIVILYNIFK